MISRQDFLGWLIFAGVVAFALGIAGWVVHYSATLLVYAGFLVWVGAALFYDAERKMQISELKKRRTHELKCWPEYFSRILDGTKTFEHRINDRDFRVGDTLYLREWRPSTKEYTGRELWITAKYIMCGFGMPENQCIMSISEPWLVEKREFIEEKP